MKVIIVCEDAVAKQYELSEQDIATNESLRACVDEGYTEVYRWNEGTFEYLRYEDEPVWKPVENMDFLKVYLAEVE